jgi:hypothetical protein
LGELALVRKTSVKPCLLVLIAVVFCLWITKYSLMGREVWQLCLSSSAMLWEASQGIWLLLQKEQCQRIFLSLCFCGVSLAKSKQRLVCAGHWCLRHYGCRRQSIMRVGNEKDGSKENMPRSTKTCALRWPLCSKILSLPYACWRLLHSRCGTSKMLWKNG